MTTVILGPTADAANAPLLIDNLGIPPLAGICTYEEAGRLGYSVDRTVDLLKRYNFVAARLNKGLAAHLAHVPEYEIKCAFGLHLWLLAEHSQQLRQRVTEMREPPHHLDDVPDAALAAWLDEVVRATTSLEVLTGIYREVLPELLRAVRRHLAEMNRLADYPTFRILHFMQHDLEAMVAWGAQACDALMLLHGEDPAAWEAHVRWFRLAAHGIAGDLTLPDDAPTPTPRANGTPYQMPSTPRRDARFSDPFNRSAKIDDYYKEPDRPMDERVCALLYKRLREIDVPEWMAPIIYTAEGKPWEYVADLSRQAWDETRHAMLGEVGIVLKGVPFYRYPVDIESSYSLNESFTPLEAHLLLWGIEQSLMPRETGKRWEWEIATASGDGLVQLFQDYDWADEVLHAQIGRRWLAPVYGTRQQMLAAWEDLFPRWLSVRDELVKQSAQHEWWPAFMADVRRAAQPQAASRATSHE